MNEIALETMNGHKLPSHYQAIAHDDLLAWLDTIPLSRPIRHLGIDFADGLLIAEIVAFYFPEHVDFDLFEVARNMSQRTKNWRILNSEVFPKLSLYAPGTVVHEIRNGDPRAIELFLLHLREKLEEHLIRTGRKSRLQWETWRSYNVEKHRLPQLINPLQTKPFRTIRPMILKRSKFDDSFPYLYEETLKNKDQQLDLIRTKLKRCESLLKIKEKTIHDLQQQLDRIKIKKGTA